MSDFALLPLSSAPRVPFRLDGRILFSSGNYELIRLTLQPGESMEIHSQPMDVVFYVEEGTGTLTVENEILEIPGRTTVHVSAGIPRAWSNKGVVPLIILVNKLLN